MLAPETVEAGRPVKARAATPLVAVPLKGTVAVPLGMFPANVKFPLTGPDATVGLKAGITEQDEYTATAPEVPVPQAFVALLGRNVKPDDTDGFVAPVPGLVSTKAALPMFVAETVCPAEVLPFACVPKFSVDAAMLHLRTLDPM